MNIKKQAPTIRSYGTPSIFAGTNLWIYDDGKWFFNGQEINMSDAPKPSSAAQLFSGKGSFQKNLDLLNARINTIHKELSYWDLYKINQTITSQEEFPAIVSALAVGQSAVINSQTFTYNGNTYHRGDVIVKISDSEELWVPAENTGVYKPTEIVHESGNTFKLKYEYTPAVNENEGTVELASTTISEGSNIYGQTAILNSAHFEFAALASGNINIKPVIKFFRQEDNQYEEIVFSDIEDCNITLSSDRWNIDLASDLVSNNLIVQVK